MRLTTAGKVTLLLIVIGAAFGLYRLFGGDFLAKLAPAKQDKPSMDVPKVDLPTIGDNSGGDSGVAPASLPGAEPGCREKPEVRLLGYAWNAHMGLLFANGGPQATKGSLMCQNGVNFKFARQDDNGKLTEALVSFATELSQGNKNPTKGAHFVTVMGDGSATFLKGLNDALRKIGPEYTAKVVGSCGYSRGEDKFMGPAGWKANPVASRGGVVAGVLRDGDWNIAQKWLSDNGLRTNPDEKTYDPDALNWIAANDYLDAAEKYITGYTEQRPVVRNGRRTGETKTIKVDGVVTWTPGDVNVATKKGGLVSIVSTKEYSAQMPNVIIGIDKWMKANRATVENMLLAITQGGEQVRNNPQALRKAAEVSAVVYNESGADAAYWEKYYKGVTENDATGQPVELGGSTVNTLGDNLLLFGLTPGGANVFAATYRVFGELVVAQYPELVSGIDPVEKVLDTTYLQALAARSAPAAKAAVAKAAPKFEKSQPVKRVISNRRWNIPFETGRAAFAPAATKELEKMYRDLLVAGGTIVEIHGHTDSAGNPQANLTLSEARAFAVQQWLQKRSPVNFPEGRVRVYAHGQQNPVAPNATEAGRAKNRRVEVILGTTGA
jgi:OmpA-OmpF porin, OOP family